MTSARQSPPPDPVPAEDRPPGRRSQWSLPPAVREDSSLAVQGFAAGPRFTLPEGAVRIEPAVVLLRWTDELDEERAISLWVGTAAAQDVAAQEAALARWIDWSQLVIPPGISVSDLAGAARDLLAELASLAHQPEWVEAFDEYERRVLTRAMRAFVRAHEGSPAIVLGGVRLVLRSESLGGVPPARDAERTLLANVLRRNLDKLPAVDAAPMLHCLMQLDPGAQVFPTHAENVLDYLLLEADLHGGFPRELALIASLPAWSNTVRLGLAEVGRSALRSARLLRALSAHLDVARSLSAHTGVEIVRHLVEALGHARFGVWTRAARSMGRLAGVLPGLPAEITRLLDPSTPVTLRRRAHAVLGTLSPGAGSELLARRDALVVDAEESWMIASFALGLPDLADRGDGAWSATARAFATRGGPESWATLMGALREIATHLPMERIRAREIAAELKVLAERHTSTSPSDAELVERALALAGRIVGQDGTAEITPWFLVTELSARVSRDPVDPTLGVAVDELSAHTDNAVQTALRAISQDQLRASARASVMLEEVVDLVVDGDLGVVAERIADGTARGSAVAYVDSLRRRMLRGVWTGMLRPTPSSVVWRRWLLKSATVLPLIEPLGTQGRDRDKIVRDQVLDTLARIADDPSVLQPGLQRYVLAALAELSSILEPTLQDEAALSVLIWMAARTGVLPSHSRTRRAFEQISPERVDRVFVLVDLLKGQAGRGTDKELQELGELAGDRCRLGTLLQSLAREVGALVGRRPEAHWSGLPKLDLTEIARVADEIKQAREEPNYALTLLESHDGKPAGESLFDRASRLNRLLTSASLKFVDAARRAEIVDNYVSELGGLCEAMANACGPVVGNPVRAHLAKVLVTVRTQAGEVARERSGDVRYIARLRVLGALASADEGGMTSTYLAEGPAPGKRVVVKLLPWERFAGVNADAARILFEREMQRLAPITHPNVVSIIDAGFVDEGAYIAIEHIPGASLETILRKFGRVDLRRLAPIIRDVARGLAYLHARGIVHRDIKPGNILVQLDVAEQGPLTEEAWAQAQFIRAVVIDLGIATDAKGSHDGGDDALAGTPGYLAPEIARGLDLITPALDVYALCVVAFEALTGVNPFLEDGPELTTVLVRHGTMVLPLDQLPDEAQRPALLHLMTEAAKLDPRARPNMREFLNRWIAALR